MITIPKATMVEMTPVESVNLSDSVKPRRTIIFAWKEGEYERSLAATAWGEKCKKFEYLMNRECMVTFTCTVREREGRFYNNITLHDVLPVLEEGSVVEEAVF